MAPKRTPAAAARTDTIAEILANYLREDNAQIDIDEIHVKPCCRPVNSLGVEMIRESFASFDVTNGNRISVYTLSPLDAAGINGLGGPAKVYGIIDGAHRVLSLRKLIESLAGPKL